MQIVIDIPEGTKRAIDIGTINQVLTSKVWAAIKNGTPVPEHYGRLIDYGYVVDAIDDWVNTEEYRYTNATDYLRKRIKNVPTIIPATKEGDKECI